MVSITEEPHSSLLKIVINLSGHVSVVATILGRTALDPVLYVLSCETLSKFLACSGIRKGCSWRNQKETGIETEV